MGTSSSERCTARTCSKLGASAIIDVSPHTANARPMSAWTVLLLAAPSFELWTPLVAHMLVALPALLELCAITFLIHSLVRAAGTAHALSMLAAFIAIVNHETGIVTYQPGQSASRCMSSYPRSRVGRAQLGYVLTLDALKLACVTASRRSLGLPDNPRAHHASTLSAADAIAPAGSWRWQGYDRRRGSES